MSIWSELITRIRTQCPIFNNNVLEVVEFAALRGNDGEMTAGISYPLCVIAEAPRDFIPLQGNATEQVVNYNFATIVAVEFIARNKTTESQVTNRAITLSNSSFTLSNNYQEFLSTVVVKNANNTVTYVNKKHYFFNPLTNTIEVFAGSGIAANATLSVSYLSKIGGRSVMDLRERCYHQLYNCLIGYFITSMPRPAKIYCTGTFHLDFTDKVLWGQVNWQMPSVIKSDINIVLPSNNYPIQNIFTNTQATYPDFDDVGLDKTDYINVRGDCYGA